MDRRVLAVLVDEELGGAVDVEVGSHRFDLRQPAACASGAGLGSRLTCVCYFQHSTSTVNVRAIAATSAVPSVSVEGAVSYGMSYASRNVLAVPEVMAKFGLPPISGPALKLEFGAG